MTLLPDSIVQPSDAELRSLLDHIQPVSIFQTSEVAELYRRAKGCKPMVLGTLDSSGGLLASVASVVFQDAPTIYHASIRGGPISRPSADGDQAARLVLRAHEQEVGHRTLYTRIYPMFRTDSSHRIAASCGFARGLWLNYHVPLSNLEKQWSKLPRARKRGIEKGEEAGFVLKDAASTADVDAAIRLLRDSARRQGIPMQHASLFRAVYELLVPRGLARIVLVEVQNATAAVRVVLLYRRWMYDWYAGYEPAYRTLRVNDWLMWEIVNWGHDRGFEYFDFGGAGVPEEPYGPRDFKKSFGGEEIELGRFTRIHHPRMLKLAELIRRLHRREVRA